MKILQIAPRMDRDVIQREHENLTRFLLDILCNTEFVLTRSNHFL